MKKKILKFLIFSCLFWPFLTSAQAKNLSKEIIQKVPFSAQAPYGGWKDQRQEDGCEEMSSLLAIKWAKNQKLTKEEALKEVLTISNWEQKKYGEYRDISSSDTLKWIINDYFGYKKAALKKAATLNDIINELKKGNIIISPMNGQLLHNPYYSAPGPLHHMIVIIGYNEQKKVFITNDPGTKRGESYRYNINTLYKAINDYPTGYHKENKTIQKNIIIISK